MGRLPHSHTPILPYLVLWGVSPQKGGGCIEDSSSTHPRSGWSAVARAKAEKCSLSPPRFVSAGSMMWSKHA